MDSCEYICYKKLTNLLSVLKDVAMSLTTLSLNKLTISVH